MFILQVLSAIILFISVIAFFSIFILGIFLGPVLKKYDQDAYQRFYAFFMLSSGILLNDYVQTNANLDRFPENKKWMLIALKRLLPTLFISFPVGCIGMYIASLS
jgi:hypothetical protein